MIYYKNPINTQDDFADPFVLRHNGQYYLYSTNQDIRCWSSVNLVNWKLEGPTITPDTFPNLVPFAPEVVYWNGSFYMYTSPSGFGHFVLKSNSPTGPFIKITGNVGHEIDGSIFIDDDGQWYFYWADDSGILGCKMKSPTEFGEPVKTGAFMHGWTEGPLVVKENGKYYMTYTGNHYLSNGYRINAACSDQPLCGYTDDLYNPIVVHTEGIGVGLGHSCSVVGPDMLSHYMVYHNFNPDATRNLNIDFQSWHRGRTVVYGPTRSKQKAPRMPDFIDFVSEESTYINWVILGGTLNYDEGFYKSGTEKFECINKINTEENYVAEYNLKADCNLNAHYGIYFGWIDRKNNYKVVLSNLYNTIKLIFVEKGEEYCLSEINLIDNYDHNALHCIRVFCEKTNICLYLDNRKLNVCIRKAQFGGKVGYFADECKLMIGCTATSNGSYEESERRLYKPVPGEFLAGCATNAAGEITEMTTNSCASYQINVEKTAEYIIDLFGVFCNSDIMQWNIILNGNTVSKKSFSDKKESVISFPVKLEEGIHTLTFLLIKGTAELHKIGIYQKFVKEMKFSENISPFGPYGKVYFGDDGWSDYILEADIKLNSKSKYGIGGLIFRMTEPAEGGEGKDLVLGINFFKGYFVGLQQDQLVLTKHSFNETYLAVKEGNWDLNRKHKLRVSAKADTFCIFVDDMETPAIIYQDKDAFTHGRIGARVKNCIFEELELCIKNDKNSNVI